MTGGSGVRLEREDVERGLSRLVRRLHDEGRAATVRLVGGAAIALAYHAERGSTVDLDAELLPEDVILEAAARVADDESWPHDWLNSAATIFLPTGFGRRGAEWTTVYEHRGVTVQVATPEMLLAMKLYSCQRRRRRELADLRILLPLCGVTSLTEAEDLLGLFYPGEEFTGPAAAVVETALSTARLPDIPPPIDLG